MRFTSNDRKNNLFLIFSSLLPSQAFTLAEVLITLAIIGMVAALTIPTLMNKIQDMQFKNAAKKDFAVCAQAIAQMKNDQGTLTNYYTTSSSFKPVFIKYFKTINSCTTNCIALADATTYQKLSKGYDDNWGWGSQFITTDGTFYGIYNNGQWGGRYGINNIVIMVDVNGYNKKPNIYGEDVFAFQLLSNNDKLIPMGDPDSYYPGHCDRTDWISYNGLGCMYNVMKGLDY